MTTRVTPRRAAAMPSVPAPVTGIDEKAELGNPTCSSTGPDLRVAPPGTRYGLWTAACRSPPGPALTGTNVGPETSHPGRSSWEPAGALQIPRREPRDPGAGPHPHPAPREPRPPAASLLHGSPTGRGGRGTARKKRRLVHDKSRMNQRRTGLQ